MGKGNFIFAEDFRSCQGCIRVMGGGSPIMVQALTKA